MQSVRIPLEDLNLTDAERRNILAMHRRVTERWVHNVNMPVTAYCSLCGEKWGKYGCATVRAADLVKLMGDRVRVLTDRIDAIQRELANVAVHAGIEHPNIRRPEIAISFKIDEYAFVQAGIGMIDPVLLQVRNALRAWWQKATEKPGAEAARQLNAALADQARLKKVPR